MKNLMASIKGYDYKGFFLRHGEKVGMGVASLIVLACLAITNWSSTFAQSPDSMKEQAQKVETQLRSNSWPETKRAEFMPVSHEMAIARVTTPVDGGQYSFATSMSHKLYTYRQPADEPEILVVTELRGASGRMPMAVLPPLGEEKAAGAENSAPPTAGLRSTGTKADTSKKAREKKAAPGGLGGYAEAMKAQAIADAQAEGGYVQGGFAMPSSVGKARGVRYNVVTGVIPRRKQLDLLQKALHFESMADAPEHLEYVDFKIQRQRAIPGPNPWPADEKSWRDLDTGVSIEIFSNEAADIDPDVVATKYTDAAITSPLPHRLGSGWTSAEVGHPKVPALDSVGRVAETIANEAAAQVVDEEGIAEDVQVPRGFRKVQRDANRLRQQAQTIGGGGGRGEGMGSYAMMMQKMALAAAAERDAEERDSSGMRGNYAAIMQSRMMGGMGDQAEGFVGRAGPVDTGADVLLFRFFDFEVEPGECYRYRVQLVIRNPSYDLAYVSNPEVAAGVDRTSNWSKPSLPVVVPRDLDFLLAKVARGVGHHDTVDVKVVQFDTDAGTMISGLLKLRYGEYVAAKKKVEHLNLAVPSLEEEEVNFTSKEILVDSAGVPPLSGTAEQDLKLNAKALQKLASKLDQAVALDRFGELVALDADSTAAYEQAEKRYNEQNEQFKKKKEATPVIGMGRGMPDNYDDSGDVGRMLMRMRTATSRGGRGGSALKKSTRGATEGGPGSFNPPPPRGRGRGRGG